ncbi:hypothetical protein JG687_00018829 [Phytophthora cactorum]|uniref:Uncharacterized protein n=1 Tax=Phytophthora cactorum TaxID=29920 RepID=A0A8T1TKU9_9STRA|nr:hypothetical protein JG687_00018829 [Phytophthora cactorum]
MKDIADYWSSSRFYRQAAFIETTARTRFQQIRGALTLHPPEHPSFDKERVPFADFAVPISVSSIDETNRAPPLRGGGTCMLFIRFGVHVSCR